jgi:hypothetical protein
MTAILTALLSAAAAFIGSWLAARFALGRFYSERIWERRAAAYTAVFEALHNHSNWFNYHIDAMKHARETSIEEVARLTAEYRKAAFELRRRIDSETWLVSDQFRQRVEKLVTELEEHQDEWIKHVAVGHVALETATDDLRQIARDELNVPHDN